MNYTALIRTFNSGPLVFQVIDSLRSQTFPPHCIMAVDSGTDKKDLEVLKQAVDQFVDVSNRPFNYSRSINQGVTHCESDYVLIISSHLLLKKPDVMERLIDSMHKSFSEVGFIISDSTDQWRLRTVDNSSFTGVNGLTNSCSFLPVSLAVLLPFREEVFSAEDQEWSKRYLRLPGAKMLGVHTNTVSYSNPHYSYRKKFNEEMALACFVDPHRMSALAIASWILKGIWSTERFDFKKSVFRFQVAMGLSSARFKIPTINSKYF